MRLITTAISLFLIGILTSFAQTPRPLNPKDSLRQCEETIRQRIAPSQVQYTNELSILMKSFQAKGDLDNLLIVKKEQERSVEAGRIDSDNIVRAPVELQNLQLKYKAWQEKLSQQTAKEFLMMLEGEKKKLTIDGKLDEALTVKNDIETIQNRYDVLRASKDSMATPLPRQSPFLSRPLPLSNFSLRRLIVKAFIDGKSVLKVQGDKLWWEHQKDSPPGKWDGRNEPTAINDQNWLPEWDGNKSQPLVCASPFIPNIVREVRLRKIKARGAATVLEQPTANNGNTLAVLFDDSKPAGADWYTIELYW